MIIKVQHTVDVKTLMMQAFHLPLLSLIVYNVNEFAYNDTVQTEFGHNKLTKWSKEN